MPLRPIGCPDDAILAAFAEGGLDAADRARVAAHVASCDRCVAHVGGLVRLARDVPDGVPPALLTRAREAAVVRPGASYWRPLAAAAVVCLSLGGWFYLQRAAPASTSVPVAADDLVRGEPASDVPRVLRPAADARVPDGPIALSWERVPQAVGYRVRLMRDDGGLLWEGDSPIASLTVPGTAALPTGAPLYLSVTAVLPDGKTSRAPSVRFVLIAE